MSISESTPEVASPETEDASTAPLSDRPPDIVCELWCEQFKQLAWFGVTGAGGTLVLLQAGYLVPSVRTGGAALILALAAATALFGQDRLVDRITAGKDIDRGVRAFRVAATAMLGAGAGALLSLLTG